VSSSTVSAPTIADATAGRDSNQFVATDTSGSLFSDVRGWHSVVVGSIYSRLFALSYDSFLAWGERSGMQTLRRSALAEATGSVLEIGAGTGLNAALFPADVERITLSEPDPAMRHRLSPAPRKPRTSARDSRCAGRSPAGRFRGSRHGGEHARSVHSRRP
jgi:hypothetical protein